MISNKEISVKDIIEKYYLNDNELLKHALIAKAEEDKKETAKDILKTEQARIYLKQLDIELVKYQQPATAPLQYTPPPQSPIVQYPHSAHPLCQDNYQLTTPISPMHESKKRHRPDDHHKVMEALKAKINKNHYDKKHRTLPKFFSSINQPKPTLPPIDTNLSRVLPHPHP